MIFFGGQDWWYHNRAHSDMQLALHVAQQRRVLLINSIGTRMPMPGRSSHVGQRIRNKLRSVARFVRRPVPELDGFYVYSPISLPLYQWRIGRVLNTALLVAQIACVRALLRMRDADIVVTPPTAWEVVRRMRRRHLIFNRSDKHSAWNEVDQVYVARCEQELLEASDAVLYVSHALMAEDEKLVGTRAVFLDHGVDLERFTPTGTVAAELGGVPRPRIGYFGALRDTTVNLDLLVSLADNLPDASLVIVGPVSMDISRLEGRSNVYLFGAQPHDRIPEFGRGFDIAIMPWLDNEWIRNCNPVKMKEYLALDRHIVTIDFPEARRYSEQIDRAADTPSFVIAVRKALGAQHPDNSHRSVVLDDSWLQRSADLIGVIDRLTV